MRRVVAAVVISALAVTAFAIGTEAQRRRRGRRPRAAPQSAEIGPALGDLQWGMTNREVFALFTKQARERYRPLLAKAPGAIEEDRLRGEMNEEVQRIRRSYVRFRGQTTGWDVSFLRDDFTHRNHESMMVVRDENSQNFYFFINDRLWKWYKAFDAAVFEGQTFDQFAEALQGRFGRAADRRGTLIEGGRQKHWLEWHDGDTRLRAVDENQFYGFYCLVFESRETLGNLARLRTHHARQRGDGHAVVDAVTSDDGPTDMSNQDVVDRLTGMIRRRTDASMMSAGGMRGMSASTMASTSSMAAVDDDDPLRGLDF